MNPLKRESFTRPAFADFEARFLKMGMTRQAVQKAYADMDPDKVACFMNDLYVVKVHELAGGCKHLVIQRIDLEPCRNWRHLQQIKNQVCGDECEAVEIYPAESRLIDAGNTYHLWVLPAGESFPFGFREGRHCNAVTHGR